MKPLRYFLETLLVRTAFFCLAWLPLHRASDLGGLVMRGIGPYTRRHTIARQNIQRAMPELEQDRLKRILSGMWDNIGRTLAEFPRLGRLDGAGFRGIIEIEGSEHLDSLPEREGGALFFSGHLANWETAPKAMAVCGRPLALVYRPGNNPGLDRIIQKTRSFYQTEGVPRDRAGSRRLISLLRSGRHIGMLVDQKMNDGLAVDFFGMPAMTATAIAALALKYDCPIVPVRTVRTGGIRHRVTILPPIGVRTSGNRKQDIAAIMARIHTLLEEWIREQPDQWIWLHRRWP